MLQRKISNEQILEFIDNTNKLLYDSQTKQASTLISLRVSNSLLAAFKLKCQQEGVLYQTEIKKLMQNKLFSK